MNARDWTTTSAKYIAAFILGGASLGGLAWSLKRQPAATVHLAPAPIIPEPAPVAPVSTRHAEPPPAAPSAILPHAPATTKPATTKQEPRPTTTSTGASPAAGHTVNLNTATQAELELLPGIGPALAQRILEHRATLGRFTHVDQLDGVKGIGPKTLAKLRPLVSVE